MFQFHPHLVINYKNFYQELILSVIAVIVAHATADCSGKAAGSVILIIFLYTATHVIRSIRRIPCCLRNALYRTAVHIVSIGRTVSVPVHMFCQISGTVITEILCLAKCIRRSNYISGGIPILLPLSSRSLSIFKLPNIT